MFTWVTELVAMRTVARDPRVWGGSTEGVEWVSTWDRVVTTAPRILPSEAAALLIALTWVLVWRRQAPWAWVAGLTATTLAMVGAVWI
jgi:hypothetical protein